MMAAANRHFSETKLRKLSSIITTCDCDIQRPDHRSDRQATQRIQTITTDQVREINEMAGRLKRHGSRPSAQRGGGAVHLRPLYLIGTATDRLHLSTLER